MGTREQCVLTRTGSLYWVFVQELWDSLSTATLGNEELFDVLSALEQQARSPWAMQEPSPSHNSLCHWQEPGFWLFGSRMMES